MARTAHKKNKWRDRVAIGPGTLAALAIVLLVAITLVLRYVVTAPPHRLVIATGSPNGYFTRTAQTYAKRFAEQGVTLEIVNTAGAMDNVARIDAPGSSIDVAFVNGGITDVARSPHLESLGSIAYDPVWVIYRSSLGVLDGIPKLKGLKIGIGGAGSGTEPIARSVLAASGIDASNSTLINAENGSNSISQSILAGDLDAAITQGPPEDPKVKALFTSDGITVMNMADAEGLSRNLSFLHALVIPRSMIDLPHQKPDRDLSIVASTITLVVRDDVHPALVYLLMSIVDDVHEPPSLIHKENEFPSDQDTDLPLNPQAETYYKSGKPFLQRYLPFGLASLVERLLKVGVPVLLILLPFFRALPAFYQWRIKRRLALVYRQLREVERGVHSPDAAHPLEHYEAEILHIERRLRAERIPVMYSNELYALREHIEVARRQIAKAVAAREGRNIPA
jgi:TRAP transporter TAXI family solute receptor